MTSDLIFGLQITMYGMGLVFALLTLLWALLALTARFEPREPAAVAAAAPTAMPALALSEEAPVATPELRIEGPGADELAPEAVAALTAAVLAHTIHMRRQAVPEMRRYSPGSLAFASRWVTAGRTRQNRNYRSERKS